MAKQTVNNADSGLVARTKINDNYTELYNKDAAQDVTIGTNQTNITALDARVTVNEADIATSFVYDNTGTSVLSTTVQDALTELANVGLAHMELSTPYTGGQTIEIAPSKLSLFDTIHHNINGAVTPVVDTSEAIPAHLYTINKSGLFSVYGNVTAEFSSSAIVGLQLYVNGIAAGQAVELQGRGAGKPVVFSYVDLATLTATDYLEVYAYSDTASTSLLITASSMIVERKPLQ